MRSQECVWSFQVQGSGGDDSPIQVLQWHLHPVIPGKESILFMVLMQANQVLIWFTFFFFFLIIVYPYILLALLSNLELYFLSWQYLESDTYAILVTHLSEPELALLRCSYSTEWTLSRDQEVGDLSSLHNLIAWSLSVLSYVNSPAEVDHTRSTSMYNYHYMDPFAFSLSAFPLLSLTYLQ